MGEMKHVLVIRLSAMGDVALMVPVLWSYAAGNPEVTFTVAAQPLLEPLFDGMSNVHFLGLKKRQSFLKIYKSLEAVGADTVVDLHKVNRVGMALMVLRLRHLFNFHFRIYALRKGRLSRWLFLHHWCRRPRKLQYQRYDDTFRRAGLKKNENIKLKIENSADTTHNSQFSILNSQFIIGIAPFSQHKGKVWPWGNVERFAKILADNGYRVILFGSKEEAPKLESLAEKLVGVESVAGKQSFAQELEIIKTLSLMVSMDSANMHFASAFGVPVVSIWGATHPDFGFYGYGQNRDNALCAELPCQPCSAYGKKPCRFGDYRCLQAISPEMVFEKIRTCVQC